MALPAFDAEKHHVGIGTSAGALGGLVVDGGYREALQAAPTATEFGSSQDIGQERSLSRWTMDDFLGGAFVRNWRTADPTQFLSSKNLIPSGLGTGLRTIPPFVLWDDELGGANYQGRVRSTFLYGNELISVFKTAGVRTRVTDKVRNTFSPDTNRDFWYGGGIDRTQFDYAVLWVCQRDNQALNQVKSTVPAPNWRRYRLDTWAALTTYNAPGAGDLQMCEFGGTVPLFAAGPKVYSADLSDTDATQPTYTLVGRLPGNWVSSCAFNGLVYILVVDSNFRSYVYQCDGTTLLPVVEFPFAFQGTCITSYAGQLFVAGTGHDFSGQASYVELYSITGSSLRLIKTFAVENRMDTSEIGAIPHDARALGVYEGMLWLGNSGDYLIAYDVVNDALYGGPALPALSAEVPLPAGQDGLRTLFCEFDLETTTDAYLYLDLTNYGSLTAGNPAYLGYEVWWDGTNGADYIAIDLECSDGSRMKGSGCVDQNGVSADPQTDLSSRAVGTWYQRNIALPAAWGGKSITKAYIACEANDGAVHRAYIRNAVVGNLSPPNLSSAAGWLWDGGAVALASAYTSGGSQTYTIVPYSPTGVQGLVVARDQLFAFLADPRSTAAFGWYRVARSGDTVSAYKGELVTSDFSPEPALLKRWSQLTLLTRSNVNNPTVEYSTDGGTTFTSATCTHTTSGEATTTLADLTPAAAAKQIRFRLRLDRGTTLTDFSELLAFTLSFAFLETGKRAWSFNLTNAGYLELDDGTAPASDVKGIHDQLWTWVSSQTALVFQDIDAEQYKVQIVGLQQNVPIVGEKLPDGSREHYLTVSLVEV